MKQITNLNTLRANFEEILARLVELANDTEKRKDFLLTDIREKEIERYEFKIQKFDELFGNLAKEEMEKPFFSCEVSESDLWLLNNYLVSAFDCKVRHLLDNSEVTKQYEEKYKRILNNFAYKLKVIMDNPLADWVYEEQN